MDLHTSASLYPAVSERDLIKLPFPRIPDKAAQTIMTQIRQAHQSRQEAQATPRAPNAPWKWRLRKERR